MPFPWAAAIGAAVSIGTSLFQSSSQNAAASASKKDAKKTAKDQFARAKVEYDISLQQDATNYAWDMARTEATKWMDEQKYLDYRHSAMNLYDQALDNLTLNTSGLVDKYKMEEGLRAQQATDNLQALNDKNKITRQAAIDQNKTGRKAVAVDEKLNLQRSLKVDTQHELRRKNLAQQAALNAQKSNAAVYQYLSSVKQRRTQSDALVRGTENEITNLLAEQTNEMGLKQLERNIRVVASMMDQGAARASAGQRGGGSSSSRRLAMNEAQKLGRTYGEIQLLRQKQGYQIEAMNASMTGEKALKLKQTAQAMRNDVRQSKSTISQTKSANKILQRQQKSIFKDRGILRKEMMSKSKQNRLKVKGLDNKLMDTKRQINDGVRRMQREMAITTEGFQLAARQGQRDLTGLYIQTQASIDQASMPYRKSIIFDPLEPIAGLPPEKRIPTFNTPESPINSYANAIMGGAQTALNFSQMTSNGLKFY